MDKFKKCAKNGLEKHLQQIAIDQLTATHGFVRKSGCSRTGKGSKDSTLVDFNMVGKKGTPPKPSSWKAI